MKFNYYDSEQISTRAASPSASTLSISPSANAKDDLSANSINERENVAPVAGKASTELNFDPEVEPRGQNSREPKDWLKDVTSGDIPQRECALKNLEWQWGIPRLVAETAVQLASNNLAIRATAQRRLEHGRL